jgi:nucleotide-binding universal stress UspA family protein
VIGAGKKSPFDRFSPGPVAETVLELASQPVLAVHPIAAAPKFQRILCPVDHSPASDRGLRNAVQLARECGSRLVVLSVVPEMSWLSAAVETGQLVGAADEYRRTWLEEYDRFLQSVDFTGVQWQKEVREGAPDREIVASAQEHEADVICMGSTGRTGLIRVLMGSVTRHVLQDLPCSLLTVKDEHLIEEPFGIDTSTAGSKSAGSVQERQR